MKLGIVAGETLTPATRSTNIKALRSNAMRQSAVLFRPYFNIVGNNMARKISFLFSSALLVSMFTFVGCGGTGGDATFVPPTDEVSAQEQQEDEDYEKQMQQDQQRMQSEGTR